jgi:hypothetical protein
MNSEFDYVLFDEMLQRHLDEMLREPESLEIGENISNISEIKIIFDGYADLETEDEEGKYVYQEGGDKTLESYAIFIHKDSAQEGFEFPEHELTPWALIHRPDEEVCIYAWYDVDDDHWEINSFDESDIKLSKEQIMDILKTLDARYFGG